MAIMPFFISESTCSISPSLPLLFSLSLLTISNVSIPLSLAYLALCYPLSQVFGHLDPFDSCIYILFHLLCLPSPRSTPQNFLALIPLYHMLLSNRRTTVMLPPTALSNFQIAHVAYTQNQYLP